MKPLAPTLLLLLDQPSISGCLIPANLIGVIQAEQSDDGRKPQHKTDCLPCQWPRGATETSNRLNSWGSN